MEKFQQVLLDVWREACRQIEIDEFTVTVARMLGRHIPLGRVIVRRVDEARRSVETVATSPVHDEVLLADPRLTCSARQMDSLLDWCTAGKVSRLPGGASGTYDPQAFLVPAGVAGEVLAGPLTHAAGISGLLLILAEDGQTFDARHEAMAQILLEPFSVALDNDRRLREMAALREAAEADKRSLLNRLGRTDLGDIIVGADSGLRLVMDRVALVARSDVPVLLLGETGTGKELVARAIHKRSRRVSGPVIRVNCGAIPSELIDSQLFGHERGAFTGAVETRKGWFERADGGTLFLDEIGELPLAAQVRLLRILQDGWLERIGGHQPINVDVRIVASTHRDLAAMVSEGRFREDLWYRLAVFPILLPPLRDRVEDIPLMARHFAERAAIRFHLPLCLPDEHDLALLASYAWPGNVRELGAVMDRAALIGNGERLEVGKALGVLNVESPVAPRLAPKTVQGATSSVAGILTLDAAMRRHIETALVCTKGRIEGSHGAAALLGINPHTLRARMRKLGVVWTRFREG